LQEIAADNSGFVQLVEFVADSKMTVADFHIYA